jgi:hypothetical protein
MPFADLIFNLYRAERDDEYDIEAVNRDSNNPGGVALPGETFRRFVPDRALLRQRIADPASYGKVLSSALFNNKDLQELFTHACVGADRLRCPLHFRLRLTSKVARLHGLRWETLLDPRDDSPLAVNQRVLFSRYLDTWHYRSPRARRPGQGLRAVVAVADPENPQEYPRRWGRLARIDVRGERERAEKALADLNPEFLAGPGEATLENLASLAGAGCDILYLACHGVLEGAEPRLFLVDKQNKAVVTSGRELAERLQRWYAQPYVVVLASCQSAGRDEEARLDEFGALAALGPRLAEAGVPAVLSMQGDVTMTTIEEFMPLFFKTLLAQGSVDHALAVARGRAYDLKRPDYWMPVLFSRMPAGQLWYTPGVTSEEEVPVEPEQREEVEFGFWDGYCPTLLVENALRF